MSFPRYPAYKDSGVEWLGEVPAHWIVTPIRHITECLDGKRIPLNSEQRADRAGDVPYWGANCIMDYIDNALFDEELVLLGEDGAPFFDRERSVAFYSAGPVWPNNHIHVLRTTSACAQKFLVHALNATDFANFIDGSTRDKLTQSEMNRIPVALPPVLEQAAVTIFLDRETAKIDALVAEQERLIALLKEKRQAVISHAVTKGLDPNAPMKPSGIEWLGDVPAHWELKGLKFVAHVQTGIAKGKDNEDREVVSVPYLRVANVQDGYLDLAEVAVIDIEADALPRYLLQAGDVLMNEGGDFDKLGRGHVWRAEIDPCIHQNHVFAVRPFGTSSEWLNLVTCSDYAQFYFMTRSKQSTNLASISSTNLMELPMLIPPENERDSIIEFVQAEIIRLDVLNTEAEHTITLLKERRSALISAAVTGQIDVRNWSAAENP